MSANTLAQLGKHFPSSHPKEVFLLDFATDRKLVLFQLPHSLYNSIVL